MSAPISLTLTLSTLNQISGRAVRVLLALYALQLGAQPVTVGLLAATFSAFPMLLAVPAGRLTDRFGARWLLVFGAAGGGLGMLVPYFVPGFVAIFIAAAMLGASTAIYNVSLQNLVGLLSTAHTRARNFSNYSLTVAVSNFMGPLIAGFSIDHFGHSNTCLYLALFTLIPVAVLIAQGDVFPRIKHREKHSRHNVRDILFEPAVRKTLITSSLLHSGGDLFQFYLPVYAHAVGLSASAIGGVLAMNSAAAFVMRTFLPRVINRLGEEKVLVYAFAVGAVSVSVIPFFTNSLILGLLAFVYGLGMGCGQPVITMLMFSSAPAGRSGETLGVRMTVNHLTRIVAPILFGFVGSAFGLASAFWLNAVMLGSGGALSYPKK